MIVENRLEKPEGISKGKADCALGQQMDQVTLRGSQAPFSMISVI